MYYYAHHIGDFQRDTAMLTDHQCMTYLRLLWIYYDSEQPLPNNARRLAFKAGSDSETVSLLLEHFFEHDGDVWRHARCDAEIAEYKRRSENSKKAAQSRWNNADAMPSQCGGNAVASKSDAGAMRSHSGGNANAPKIDANQEPRTNNQDKKRDMGKTATRFVPPTPDEVSRYCKERKNLVDAERFVDFYAAKGWMVGKNKMKDWKAAVRTWEANSKTEAPARKRKML